MIATSRHNFFRDGSNASVGHRRIYFIIGFLRRLLFPQVSNTKSGPCFGDKCDQHLTWKNVQTGLRENYELKGIPIRETPENPKVRCT